MRDEFKVDGEIHMKRKKNICLITMLILALSMLSACGNKMTTNKFNNEAILGIEIKKIEAYLDKLVVTFADDSLSEIEKIEIDYYGTDNSVITETPDFSFQKNVLTIETNHADEVSEMRIWDKDRDLYFYVRYIYTDSYAMLVYSWADDAGYLVNGDEDAFYTEEEKEAQEELEELQAEAETFAYSRLMGEWINESENVCIVFSVNDEYKERYFAVSELIDGEWKECDLMVIGDLSEYSAGEADMFNLCDNPSFGRQVTFYLFGDTVMECDYSDERFFKIK